MKRTLSTTLAVVSVLALCAAPGAAAVQPAAPPAVDDAGGVSGQIVRTPLEATLDQALTDTCNDSFGIEVPLIQCTVEDCIQLCAAEGADTIGPIGSRMYCVCICCDG